MPKKKRKNPLKELIANHDGQIDQYTQLMSVLMEESDSQTIIIKMGNASEKTTPLHLVYDRKNYYWKYGGKIIPITDLDTILPFIKQTFNTK